MRPPIIVIVTTIAMMVVMVSVSRFMRVSVAVRSSAYVDVRAKPMPRWFTSAMRMAEHG